jgi:hypothetical protein
MIGKESDFGRLIKTTMKHFCFIEIFIEKNKGFPFSMAYKDIGMKQKEAMRVS